MPAFRILVVFVFVFVSLFAHGAAYSQELVGITALKLPVNEPPAISKPKDRPLLPALKLAIEKYKHIRDNVDDYSCVVVRQERVDGRLGPNEFIYAKVRNPKKVEGNETVPLSIYLKFLKPSNVKDREVLYVQGQNGNEMFIRRGGKRFAFVTTTLAPQSALAMQGNRYPITEFGIENLVKRLVQVSKRNLDSNCDVKFLETAKIDKRPCTGIVVTFSERATNPDFHQARIFIDEQLNIPVHYESYDWPETSGGEPLLLERYTYMKLRVNNGFTDADFSADNPNYNVK